MEIVVADDTLLASHLGRHVAVIAVSWITVVLGVLRHTELTSNAYFQLPDGIEYVCEPANIIFGIGTGFEIIGTEESPEGITERSLH